MKQYTESERAALIDFLQNSRVFTYDEAFELRKMRDEIALAALTAEPVTLDSVQWNAPLYQVPPVASLVLPKELTHQMGDFPINTASINSWNACIDEVKRLNATAPAEGKK